MDEQRSTRGDIEAEGDGGVRVATSGAALVLTLDRVARLNAVNRAMRARLVEAFVNSGRDPQIYAAVLKSAHERVFSVGGDVRELLAAAGQGQQAAADWISEECSLIWLADCFSRPMVSLIDGSVIGTGVGLSLAGTHRAAGEQFSFQMPETGIGFFPDVGTAHVFARMPDELGVYLGLTGRPINRADAYMLDIVTHCVPASEFGGIEAELADAQPIDQVLDSRHSDPGPGQLETLRGTIAHCFSAPTVLEIVDRLGRHGDDREWCLQAKAELEAKSPLVLEVTLRHIRQAKALNLRQTLMVDHRIGTRLAMRQDFAEGVKSQLIAKTGKAVWQPRSLRDVTASMISEVLKPVNGPGLNLPTRQEMEAGPTRG